MFPGDRRVWRVAAGLGALFAIAIAIALLVPRDYYTGTNSVGPGAYVLKLNGGQRLCLPGLRIPADTGRIQLQIDTAIPRPAFDAEVRTPQGVVRGRLAPSTRAHTKFANIPIPKRPSSPESVAGTVCVTPARGPVQVAGYGGLSTDQPAPTVNGKRISDRIGVWFLPPRGERRSLASLAPDILKRAELFRPGIVGQWTFVALLVLVMPFAVYLAVRFLATAESRTRRRLVVGIAALAFVNAAAWSVVTPMFNVPDEYDHFAYVQYFAETGKRPGGDALPYSGAERAAVDALSANTQVQQPAARPPWLIQDQRRWSKRQGTHPPPRRDDGGGETTAATHSPLYYALVSPAYVATRGSSIFAQITAVRLLSALFGAIVAACAFGIVLELVPRQRLVAAGAGLFVAFFPMFGFMSGGVNNDMGANAVGAILLYLVVRGLRRGPTVWTAAGIGAAMVVLPLMKGTGAALFPAAVVGLLAMAWRSRRHLDPRPWVGLAAGLGGTYLLSKLFLSLVQRQGGGGQVGPTAGVVANSATGHIPTYLAYLWQVFLPRLPFMTDYQPKQWPTAGFDVYVKSAWGAFGWNSLTFPLWVYIVIVAVIVVVVAFAALTLWRHRDAARRRLAEMAVLVLAVVGVIAGIEAAYFNPAGNGAALPEQGRYTFTALAAFAAMAMGATLAFGRRWVAPIATALVVSVVGLDYASQLLTLARFYA